MVHYSVHIVFPSWDYHCHCLLVILWKISYVKFNSMFLRWMRTMIWLATPVTLTRTGIVWAHQSSHLYLSGSVFILQVKFAPAITSVSCPVMAMVTKTLGTTAQLSSTALSWILTKMERETSVMMTMTTMGSQTCCHLVLITAVWSPTLYRRTLTVCDTVDILK